MRGKKKINFWFTVFFYASVLFFAVYLFRQKDLQVHVYRMDPLWLTLSVVLLWAGFFAATLSWRKALQVHDIHISVRMGVYSHGISVLGKYIPGKVWVIVGRAFPVTGGGVAFHRATLASLKEQLLYLFLGLFISVVPVLIYYPAGYVTLILVVSLLLLGLVLFVPAVHRQASSLLGKVTGKELDLPLIDLKQSAGMGVYILFYWLLWTAGFWFFLISLAGDIPWVQALAFPLSVCYGVMAIIFPGGIGIRESIMTGFLVLTGMDAETAVTISLLNRLWYITGELFIFFLALFLGIGMKKKSRRSAAL